MNTVPLTIKRSIELLGLCAIFGIMSVAANVITPLLIAFFVSILLMPVFGFFRRLRFPEILAIVSSIGIAAIVIGGIVAFFSFQVSDLVSDIPQLKKNSTAHWQTLSKWISSKTHYSRSEQLEAIQTQAGNLTDNVGAYFQTVFSSLTSAFIFLGLLPIYIFLIMFYRKLLLKFAYMWFKPADHANVTAALVETQIITKSYLVGLLIQIGYITVLLGGLLWVLGIKHALLIGIIFAILNLIPYVGALVGNVIGVALTLASSPELRDVITVLLSIAAVQFLDNNILMPRIVGSKVKINALVSIVGVVIGGAVAGVGGMFLSLPVMAVLKVVFDRTDSFKQWGVLLGDERPTTTPMNKQVVEATKAEVKDEIKQSKNDKDSL